MEARDTGTGATETERIVEHCYEQLYTNKLGNVEETDKLLETHNLPRLKKYKPEQIYNW